MVWVCSFFASSSPGWSLGHHHPLRSFVHFHSIIVVRSLIVVALACSSCFCSCSCCYSCQDASHRARVGLLLVLRPSQFARFQAMTLVCAHECRWRCKEMCGVAWKHTCMLRSCSKVRVRYSICCGRFSPLFVALLWVAARVWLSVSSARIVMDWRRVGAGCQSILCRFCVQQCLFVVVCISLL